MSTELVASSRMRIAGSARKARAMVMSWRSPAETLDALLIENSPVAVGERAHEVVDVGRLRRGDDFLLASPPASRRRCSRRSCP